MPKIWSCEEKKIGFDLLSANLVVTLVGVLQAQIFGCACLKCKWVKTKLLPRELYSIVRGGLTS